MRLRVECVLALESESARSQLRETRAAAITLPAVNNVVQAVSTIDKQRVNTKQRFSFCFSLCEPGKRSECASNPSQDLCYLPETELCRALSLPARGVAALTLFDSTRECVFSSKTLQLAAQTLACCVFLLLKLRRILSKPELNEVKQSFLV